MFQVKRFDAVLFEGSKSACLNFVAAYQLHKVTIIYQVPKERKTWLLSACKSFTPYVALFCAVAGYFGLLGL